VHLFTVKFYNYTNSSKIVVASNDLAKISSGLLAETQRNMHHSTGPERMPSPKECEAMLHQQEIIADAIQRVRESVSRQDLQDQRIHGTNGKLPSEYEQDEMGQWTDEGKMGYGGQDAKKRRGVCSV
jgi:hypothetical protein